ncbi:hypothetical protein SK128_014256 [Halocaridina rubra]|uniref:Carbohydrate sulfotransferase n=1 Tax=Halocaridina rubra TaxID=373956 RepID=A0AAN8XWZ0_HALRR
MRFSIRRHLKLLLYLFIAIFCLNFLQKKSLGQQGETIPSARIKQDQIFPNAEKETINGKVFEIVPDLNEDKIDDDDDEQEYREDENDSGPDPDDLVIVKSNMDVEKQVRIEGHKLTHNKDEDFFKGREKVYQERRDHIQKICDQLGMDVTYGDRYKAPLRRLRWLNKHKLIMCFNAKVGTSTWTQYLLEAGFPGLLKKTIHWHATAEKLLKPPHSRHSNEAILLMKNYTKIILVRDPFARIVSAYLDKIAMKRFKKICRFIIGKYRQEGSEKAQSPPTFEEFVRFLVDHTPSTDNIWAKRNHRSDRHWFHYYANCAPCDIHYDVVATMESVHNDTR